MKIKITLSQREIGQAVTNYISSMGVDKLVNDPSNIDIELDNESSNRSFSTYKCIVLFEEEFEKSKQTN
ncbi:MAG: hypothetical protein ACXABY_32860 [Candidatus Thorarchaeota archaeon]|jgi:hypothetical protein